MSLFFALWPPPETARALAQWAKSIEGRTTAEAKIHLTLAFLGNADAGRASAAAASVRGRAFELAVDQARFWKHNRIVWAGPAEMPDRLAALVDQLHAALRQAGFVLEDRPFAAHVTLVRKAGAPAAFPPLPAVEWPVAEFLLCRSAGGRYDTLERFPLK